MNDLETANLVFVFVRTSGPAAGRNGILEIGSARFCFDGRERDDSREVFEEPCSIRAGAVFDQGAAELTGISETSHAESPLISTEFEAAAEWRKWAGLCDRPKAKFILAGSQPGLARQFLKGAGVEGLPKRLFDLQSAFYLLRLATGAGNLACGWPTWRIFEELGLPGSNPRMPAGEAAEREREAFAEIFRRIKPARGAGAARARLTRSR